MPEAPRTKEPVSAEPVGPDMELPLSLKSCCPEVMVPEELRVNAPTVASEFAPAAPESEKARDPSVLWVALLWMSRVPLPVPPWSKREMSPCRVPCHLGRMDRAGVGAGGGVAGAGAEIIGGAHVAE